MNIYSASQLTTFIRCNLRWWWERVGGFRSPPSAAMQRGTEIHAEIEAWLKEGTPPTDPRALEAVRHLGDPEQWISEGRIDKQIGSDVRFVGYVDLAGGEAELPKIVDMKTTSDVKRYGKVSYQLAEDVQLNCYAQHAFESFPEAQEVQAGHLQIQTRGAVRSQLTWAEEVGRDRLSREKVAERWSSYLRVIDDMEVARTRESPNSIAYNEDACDDYGGCPHRARCAALGVFDLLNPPDTTRRPEGAAPATPATVDPIALPEGWAEKGPYMNPLERLAAIGGGKVTVEEPPKDKVESLKEKAQAPTVGGDSEIVKTKRAKGTWKLDQAGQPRDPNAPPPTPKEESKVTPLETPTIKTTVLPAPDDMGTSNIPSDAILSRSDPPVGELLFLFIDCYPQHGFPQRPVRLGQWLAPVLEKIKSSTGADWQFHEYRKASAILNQFARREPLPEALIVDGRSPEASALWEYFISKAGVIVQGCK